MSRSATLLKLASILLAASFSFSVTAQSLPDFTVLVEKNAPAIVNVSTTRKVSEADASQRANLGELLRYFYGDRVPDIELPEPQARESAATGSGFIIDKDGYVVTNHHVIADADEITITLNDQREFFATVVGSDERSDLALLRIEATNLPQVKMGDSSKLKVGEWVLAIGSPFGLQYSVAAGIISYMGRSLPSEGGNYVSFIQTDVAINPGHSGGPLFNLQGEVIGINSQIFTSSGGSIGLSFAIPVDVAKNVVTQLKDSGVVKRGWMGVGIEDVNQNLSEAFGLETPHGALINRVINGGPAEAAGIQLGDIIVEFNDHPIRTSADLPYYVGLELPGSEVKIAIVREGKPRTLVMEVGILESVTANQSPDAVIGRNRIGLTVEPLEDEGLAALGINKAVVIQTAEGPAEEARLQPGDVIITLNSEAVGSQEELDQLAARLPADRALPVLVARGQRQTFFTIRIDE